MKVICGHIRSSVPSSLPIPNYRLRRDKDVGVASLRLSRQDASADMQHDPLRSSSDLNQQPNVDLTFQSHYEYVSTRLDERNTMASKLCPLLSLFKSYLRRTIFAQNSHFDLRSPWGLNIKATSKQTKSIFKTYLRTIYIFRSPSLS